MLFRYIGISPETAKTPPATVGGKANLDDSPRNSTRMLFAQGRKSPHGQTASNDHCNPGGGHRYFEASDMHCPLIHSTYSLKYSDHTEEDA